MFFFNISARLFLAWYHSKCSYPHMSKKSALFHVYILDQFLNYFNLTIKNIRLFALL